MIEQQRISLILSLTSRAEIEAKSPSYAAAMLAGALPSERREFAVPDFGVPERLDSFVDFLTEAAMALHGGMGVMLHCAAGVGRTGTAALCLLHLLGVPAAEAEARVLAAGSHPETPAQRDFVLRFRAAQSPGRMPAA